MAVGTANALEIGGRRTIVIHRVPLALPKGQYTRKPVGTERHGPKRAKECSGGREPADNVACSLQAAQAALEASRARGCHWLCQCDRMHTDTVSNPIVHKAACTLSRAA